MENNTPVTRRTDQLRSFFKSDHLPEHLKPVSQACEGLVNAILIELPEDSAELTAGLRKLLEAKDCFVRARLLEG